MVVTFLCSRNCHFYVVISLAVSFFVVTKLSLRAVTKSSFLWSNKIVITKLSLFCSYHYCLYQKVTLLSWHYHIVITKLSITNWRYQKLANHIITYWVSDETWQLVKSFECLHPHIVLDMKDVLQFISLIKAFTQI